MSFPIASSTEQFAALMGDRETTAESVWLVWQYDYEQSYVVAAFPTEVLAVGYVADRPEDDNLGVEAVPMHRESVGRIEQFHMGAAVYPDGAAKRWESTSMIDGPGAPLLDKGPFHGVDNPWGGHTQGHCGYHVSVFGCDRETVKAEVERQIAEYQPVASGRCSCGKTGPYVLGWDREGWIEADGSVRLPPEWQRLVDISRPCVKSGDGWRSPGSEVCTGCGAPARRWSFFGMDRWDMGMRWMSLCDDCSAPYENMCMSCLVPREGKMCPKCGSWVASSTSSFGGDAP